MTAKTIYISDISGEPDAVRATVGFDGEWHEIDLSPDEMEALTMGLGPYIRAGRRLGKSLDDGRKRVVPETTAQEREEIRAWARENGYEFAERGRIPKRILAAYSEAHGLGKALSA